MTAYDAEKLMECMLDEVTGPIIAELESGPKNMGYLMDKYGLDMNEIEDKLGYMIEHGFIIRNDDMLTADAEKLASLMENEENYNGIIDSVTEMDSYLN